jgi:hypothetical protein
VRTRGDLTRPEEFGSLVVLQQGDQLVRLKDVAEVELGAEDDRSVARFNGIPAVGLGIVKQQKASTVDVAHRVKASLDDLRGAIPAGMKLAIAYDSSTFIEDSIHEVVVSLGVAFGLVILVIFLFLGSLRATLIPVVAIPVSIIGTFTATYFMGFSLNILTLLALVLAIGLVVDDAIVMLENAYRHLEMGKPRMRAAIDAAREIGFAILATTITLVAVFIPVAFLTGRIGRLFNEFGLAVAVSVLISGFVALTLTPMLCSRMLKRKAFGAGHDATATGGADTPGSGAGRPVRARRGALALRPFLPAPPRLLRARAAPRDAPPRGHDGRDGRADRDDRAHVQGAPLGAGADRGSRTDLQPGAGARGLDARVHRPLRAARRGDLSEGARGAEPVHRGRAQRRRAGPRHRRLRVREAQALRPAQALAAADRPVAVPGDAPVAGRAGVPDQSAEPRRRIRQSGAVRAAGRDVRRPPARAGADDGRGAEARLSDQPQHRPQAQQATARDPDRS